MYSITVPKVKTKQSKKNSLGLTIESYQGAVSTLCGGCGHDSITAAIVKACFELALPPHRVGKLSGIGCSSKTPGYFLQSSHGFNAVHGRMPSVATGAYAAEKTMPYLAVSGDGDTGSIGLGQFVHALRRQINVLYIVENNGVYGLTKGQFSATADHGSVSKKKSSNPFQPIDLVQLAIQLGAGFVARSFSGDKDQLVPLIKAGLQFNGFAVIDALSPCVSFNNHLGSTKSYQSIRESELEVAVIKDLVPEREEIKVDYPKGASIDISLHDGATLSLIKTLDEYQPTNRNNAMDFLQDCATKGRVPTGILYINPETKEFGDVIQLPARPLRSIPYNELHPGASELRNINNNLR